MTGTTRLTGTTILARAEAVADARMTDAMRGDALRDFLSSNVIFSKVLEFLSSKSFGDTESALRKELQELLAKGLTLADLNQFTSELERDLQLPISLPKEISLPDESTSDEHRARGLLALNTSQGPSAECTAEQVASLDRVDALLLFKAVPYVGPLASELRKKRGLGTAREHVTFHELEAMPADEETAIVRLNLPMVFNPNLNGLEDERELHLHGGDIVAGRYRVARKLGTGSFSTSYQCFQVFEGSDARSDGPATGRWVSIKVLRNDKDCYDTGCSEIRMLNSIKTKDPAGVHHLLRYALHCPCPSPLPVSLAPRPCPYPLPVSLPPAPPTISWPYHPAAPASRLLRTRAQPLPVRAGWRRSSIGVSTCSS